MDAWLIILTIFFSFVTLAFSLLVLLYFKDKNEEGGVSIWIGRAIVVINILLSTAMLSSLPLDVSNSRLSLDS